jgi:hypothetical protein
MCHLGKTLCVFVGFVIWIKPLRVAAQIPAPNSQTLELIGRGTSRWAAREDAVRQALQQVVAQLVIADRQINSDEILRDEVRSTLNGYVEKFEVVKQDYIDNQFVISARITVSPSRIATSVEQKRVGKDLSFNGEGFGAAVAAKRMRDSATVGMLDRLFEGYPQQTVDARIASVKVEVEQEVVVVTYEMGIAVDFVSRVKAGLEELAKSGAAVTKCTIKNFWCEGRGFRISLGGDWKGNTWMISKGVEEAWSRTAEQKAKAVGSMLTALRFGDFLLLGSHEVDDCLPPVLQASGSADFQVSTCRLSFRTVVPVAYVRDASRVTIDPFPELGARPPRNDDFSELTYEGRSWTRRDCDIEAMMCFAIGPAVQTSNDGEPRAMSRNGNERIERDVGDPPRIASEAKALFDDEQYAEAGFRASAGLSKFPGERTLSLILLNSASAIYKTSEEQARVEDFRPALQFLRSSEKTIEDSLRPQSYFLRGVMAIVSGQQLLKRAQQEQSCSLAENGRDLLMEAASALPKGPPSSAVEISTLQGALRQLEPAAGQLARAFCKR